MLKLVKIHINLSPPSDLMENGYTNTQEIRAYIIKHILDST